MRAKTICMLFFGFILLAGSAAPLWACPMCKAGLMSAINPRYLTRLAEGYFWSIVLMLSIPFLMVGTVAFFIAKSYRNAER